MFQSNVTFLRKIQFDKDINGPVKFETDDGAFVLKRKDFYAAFDHDWEGELISGTKLRVWTVQASRVAGVEAFRPVENTFYAVWYVGNNFDTKEEADKKLNDYVKFIDDEGNKIAQFIDEKKSFSEISSLLSDQHTGNTIGMAFSLGTKNAKDRAQADIIRQEFNDLHGVSEADAKGGIVNPAIINVAAERMKGEQDGKS